jgi:predicted component of type VI protein secretion system
MDKIILYFKEASLKEMPLEKDVTTIGRKPENDLVIDNLAVSGFHAKVVREGGQVYIEDLSSLNGTFVNDKKVARCILRNKDKIIIGKHSIAFLTDRVVPEAGTASRPATADLDKTMVLPVKSGTAAAPKEGEVGIGGFSVIEGPAELPEYELSARLSTIGKSDTAAIKLKGLLAPKVGALVNRSKDGYYIAPPSDGGKVKVNGTQITGRAKLKEGDLVEVHNLKLQFFMKG